MKQKINLQLMSENDLVARFLEIGLAQYEAIEMGENSKYRRLYWQMEDVSYELKMRPRDQRRALLPLLKHKNAQVRLKAAIETLPLAPVISRQTLQTISDQHEYPQAIDARGMLRALDDGSYVPS